MKEYVDFAPSFLCNHGSRRRPKHLVLDGDKNSSKYYVQVKDPEVVVKRPPETTRSGRHLRGPHTHTTSSIRLPQGTCLMNPKLKTAKVNIWNTGTLSMYLRHGDRGVKMFTLIRTKDGVSQHHSFFSNYIHFTHRTMDRVIFVTTQSITSLIVTEPLPLGININTCFIIVPDPYLIFWICFFS